jgi:hypothetical protein
MLLSGRFLQGVPLFAFGDLYFPVSSVGYFSGSKIRYHNAVIITVLIKKAATSEPAFPPCGQAVLGYVK